MVPGSVATLSLTFSFPSCSSRESSLLYNPSARPRSPRPLVGRRLRFLNPASPYPSPRYLVINAYSGHRIQERSAEQFSQTNTLGDFLRYKQAADGSSGELQTAVVRYRKKFPWILLKPSLQVDLVSTIHIADKEYFATIQRELKHLDCVLYEMVASKESLRKCKNSMVRHRSKNKRSSGFNIIGFLQKQIARILMLDFQLDCLDYWAEDWYHADLDYETFESLQFQKGENIFTFARDMTVKSTKALVEATSMPEDPDPAWSKLRQALRFLPMPLIGSLIIGRFVADMGIHVSENPAVKAFSRLDFGAAMKFLLAQQLTSELMQETAEVEEMSVIIGERNRAAMETLRRAVEMGHRKIAILYGGGHMPDLGRRLQEEFHMVPSQVWWITAWSIRSRDLKSGPSIPLLGSSGWPLDPYQTLALLLLSSFLALDLYFWELFFGSAVGWFSNMG